MTAKDIMWVTTIFPTVVTYKATEWTYSRIVGMCLPKTHNTPYIKYNGNILLIVGEMLLPTIFAGWVAHKTYQALQYEDDT